MLDKGANEILYNNLDTLIEVEIVSEPSLNGLLSALHKIVIKLDEESAIERKEYGRDGYWGGYASGLDTASGMLGDLLDSCNN